MVPSQPKLSGIVLAQVVSVSPDDHALGVIFSTLSGIFPAGTGSPLQVKVLQRRGSINAAVLEIPQVGEWGLVCFPHGSDQMAVWLGSINQDASNLAWDGIGKTTRLDQHESGAYSLVDDAGNLDVSFPDGTYVRVGTGSTPADRFHHERQGDVRRSVPFSPPTGAPATVHLHHSSGSSVQIDPDGTVTVQGITDVTVNADGAVTVDAFSVTVESQSSVDVSGASAVTVAGGGSAMTILGGAAGAQLVVLLLGLTNLITWLASHTHTNVKAGPDTSGPPSVPPTAPVPGTDYSIKTVAS